MPDVNRINNTLGKLSYYLSNHNNAVVAVSGGSDSDIVTHMIATYCREFLPKVHFAFVDTGLEWPATRQHIKDLRTRYDIKIDVVKGVPIVSAVYHYGVPLISKYHSQVISSYCRNVPYAIRKVNLSRTVAKGYTFSSKQRQLAEAVKNRKIKVSDKCCKISKKIPSDTYCKSCNCDLFITGERKYEGGQRAISHTSCFEPNSKGKWDKFMPLFFWDDATKQWYKEHEKIQYSDCYEVYGLRRTGCVGCPFNSRINEDLKIMAEHEPRLLKACLNVFGESYRLMDEFGIRKTPVLQGIDEEV